MIAFEMMKNLQLATVRMRYYNSAYQTYKAINSNNSYITSQNETIARNNEIIAQQQRIIAENNDIIARQNLAIARATPSGPIFTDDNRFLAAAAYDEAQRAGLVQSYAASGADYFYQDGVFYTSYNGQYRVIVPPAGALVEYLPEDYDIVTLGGRQYYQVDDTVYQVTTVDGNAYFEVVGQLSDYR